MADGFVLSKKAGPDKSAPRAAPAATSGGNKAGEVNADDGYVLHQWRKERIWIEAIDTENKSRRNWEETWSFMADYDPKGNIKPKKELPERVNMFSETMPNSCGHEYGARLSTEIATQMTVMQNSFSVGNKKRRNNDLIAYD